MPTAFVTGGSGFVGGRLIERLARDGWSVRALARSDRAADAVRVRGAEPVRGELGDLSALVAGMEGADVAFHAAAKVEDFGPWQEFVAANVEGTRNVLRACRAAAVGRAVHVSTEAVLMHGQPLVHVDETYPLALRSQAPYSRSKAMAEQVVLEEGRGALEAMIVRPRFVWGRGDTTLLPVLVEGTRSGAFRWVGGGRHLTSTTHVENTVEGLLVRRRARPRRARLLRHRRRPAAVPRLRRRADRHPGRDAAGRAASRRRSPGRSPRPARPPGSCCRCAARRRSRASRPGSPRRSARSTTRAPAASSATRRSSRARQGMRELRDAV